MSMKIKHSKYRNTGLIFELLIRQVTSDLMYNSKDSKAVNILKKYFQGTELAKELSLYGSITAATDLSEQKADTLINAACTESAKLNQQKLQKEKYNLIKEVQSFYDVENFFKAEVQDYRDLAAVYTLFEASRAKEVVAPEQIVQNKIRLLERLTKPTAPALDGGVKEFSRQDRDIKVLSYKILVESFNKKYDKLTKKQKYILREYINNVTDTVKLKNFVNEELAYVKAKLTPYEKRVDSPVTLLKLQEVIKNIKPLGDRGKVKDDHLSALMQYYGLLTELQKIHPL
jgi:hypothetical protein